MYYLCWIAAAVGLLVEGAFHGIIGVIFYGMYAAAIIWVLTSFLVQCQVL